MLGKLNESQNESQNESSPVFELGPIPPSTSPDCLQDDFFFQGGNVLSTTLGERPIILCNPVRYTGPAQTKDGSGVTKWMNENLNPKPAHVLEVKLDLDKFILYFKGKKKALHFLALNYYHLDLFVHVTPDNKVIILNQNIMLKKSYDLLEEHFGKKNIIDLQIPMEQITSAAPSLNAISIKTANGTKVFFHKLEKTIQKKLIERLPGSRVIFSDLACLGDLGGYSSFFGNTAGGAHCLSQQTPKPNKPGKKQSPC